MTTKEILKLAVACGLTVRVGTKHLKIISPETGKMVAVVPFNKRKDSGGRQEENLVSTLRRHRVTS